MISFTRLHERLYMRGHTKGVNAQRMMWALAAHDIRTVVNVAIIKDGLLEAAMRTVGMTYIHEPLSDSQTGRLPEEKIRRLVADVTDEISNGIGVLVHCDSGRNRSALVALPALHELTHRPMDELLAEVRSKRPIARGVLANKAFEKFVLEWPGVPY